MADSPEEATAIYAMKVGNICAVWSSIEYLVALTIWELLHLDYETGQIITGGTDMLPRLNMAIALAEQLKAGRPLITALRSLRKTLQDGLDQRRNQAVHGVNRITKGKHLVEMHRGTFRGSPRELPIASLQQTIDDLMAAYRAYASSLEKWLPHWADKAARKMRSTAEETASSPGT